MYGLKMRTTWYSIMISINQRKELLDRFHLNSSLRRAQVSSVRVSSEIVSQKIIQRLNVQAYCFFG